MNTEVIRSGPEPRVSCPFEGRNGFLQSEGRLHLVADWDDVAFMNFRIASGRLQPFVPFPLEICEGSAWVSLVAFTMRDMRPSVGGRIGRMLFKPFRIQRFLNVRTYVKLGEESGIHFIAEWISDWFNARLDPTLYGPLYRLGRLSHRCGESIICGNIMAEEREFAFDCNWVPDEMGSCSIPRADSCWNVTRHTIQPEAWGWHEPWEQTEAELKIHSDRLPLATFPWWERVEYAGCRHSPGAKGVLMGRPRSVIPPR